MSLQIASKVAAPLARTNEIVILSGEGSRVTGELNRLLAELPVSVNALTGVDLSKVTSLYNFIYDAFLLTFVIQRVGFKFLFPV